LCCPPLPQKSWKSWKSWKALAKGGSQPSSTFHFYTFDWRVLVRSQAQPFIFLILTGGLWFAAKFDLSFLYF
jgi:hypothetical protein